MITIELLCKLFECGIDYGLFLAETERDSEDLSYAMLNTHYIA